MKKSSASSVPFASVDEVTTTVSRHILPGKEKEFDAWMHRIATAVEQVPGFRSISVITPAKEASVRFVVYKFSDVPSLDAWERSETKRNFLKELKGIATQHYARKSGLETWFTLREHDLHAPPRWKMALAAFSGVFLIGIVSRTLLAKYTASWPLSAATAFYGALTVAILTWLYMPQFTRIFRRWLYPTQK